MTAAPRTRVAAAAAALTLTGLLAACGTSGDEATKTSGPSTTTTAEATSTTAATSSSSTTTTAAATTSTTDPADNPEGTDTETSNLGHLDDGDHYGYIAGVESGTVEGQKVQVIVWDEAQMLTGDAAVQAAHEDKAIPDDQDFVENDYYIRNENQTVRRLAVDPDATITSLQDGSPDEVPATLDQVWHQDHLFVLKVVNAGGTSEVKGIKAVFLP